MLKVEEALELAMQHHRAGRLAEAAAVYRQVIAADAQQSDALWLLGRIELQQGRAAAAVELLRKAIVAAPAQAPYHNSLGDAWLALSKIESAIEAYRAAVRLQPDDALGHGNLGNALLASKELGAAEVAYRQAIGLQPDAFGYHNNLGVTLRELGRLAEARECFAEALGQNPRSAEAHSNLGNTLSDLGEHEAAIAAYRRALNINPTYAPAQFNLGNALKRAGQFAAAMEAYRRATELDPSDAQARTNLGALLSRFERVDEAVDECRRAVALDDRFALAHNNLGSCLHARGQIEEALPHYRRAAELQPDDSLLVSNLAHAMLYAPNTCPQAIFEQHRRWAARHADPLAPVASRPFDGRSDRKIRVGYVSAHFRDHAIAVFSEPLLAHHDHDKFEVVCYSDVRTPDLAMTRFRSYADHWVDTLAMSDEQLAQQVAADEVDILVDLTGHLEGNRLLAFARKPAPIQVTYLGYQATTGMAAMDYRLTDAWSDPVGANDPLHTEQLIRLPDAFFCYRPLDSAPEVNDRPAVAAGNITFGSFNKLAKLTQEMLANWAQILERVGDSRLLVLGATSSEALERIRLAMKVRGVAPQRVEMAARRPRAEYLSLHHEVDIVLDTFPFNGHTTVCEALWMGVPVVTRAGQTYVERFGSSALANLGLADLISSSSMEYIEIAVRLAQDRDRLARLRRELRRRMRAATLLDGEGFTRKVEAEYLAMWQRMRTERAG